MTLVSTAGFIIEGSVQYMLSAMFLKKHFPTRLASLVVSFALGTVATLSVCPALAASLVDDTHHCCKTSGNATPASDNSSCRVKCAGSSTSVVTPIGLNAGASLLDLNSPARAEANAPDLNVEMRVARGIRPAGPLRPLYERTSALLI